MTIYAPPSIDPRSWTLLSDIDREADEACRRDLESALLPEERVYLLGEKPGGTINRVTFGPTAWQFINCDDAEVLVLYGPRRESKTMAGISRLLRLAQTYPKVRPIRAAIVRDTHVNLKRTVIQNIYEGAARGWWDADFRDQETEVWLNGNEVHVLLMGMERPADATRFQGLGLGAVIIEEPAPAADMTSGVPVEVFAMAVTSLSQPGLPPSVALITNPPDEDHWLVQLVDALISRADPKMRVKTFWVPPGENRHVSQAYRDRMRIGLEVANRGDLVRRLAEGKLGSVKVGEPVTPEFNEERHVAKEALEVRRNFPTFRFFDLWHSPAIVWAQQTPLGYLHVLGCIQGENMGVEELIATHIIPWEHQYGLTAPRSADPFSGGPLTSGTRARPIRTIIDPSGKSGDQSSTERSAAKVIEKMLGTTCEYGPVAWSARRDAVKALLARSIRGRAQVQIDPEALPLIRALRGGWRYPKTSSGHIGRLPTKDMHCVDKQTEILTPSGFRRWDDLEVGMPVYGFDLQTRRLVPDRLVAIHDDAAPREMLSWEHRSVSIVATPNHRMIVCRGEFNTHGPVRWKALEIRAAQTITASTHALPGMNGLANFPRTRRFSDEFIRLCAWVMTEGHYRKGDPEIWITQSPAHPEYVDQLSKLVASWPGLASQRMNGANWAFVLRRELSVLIRHLMPDKRPSPEFLSQLRRPDMIVFLFEALKGDGAHRSGPLPLLGAGVTRKGFWRHFGRQNTPVLCCASPAEADVVQHMATMVGIRAQPRLGDRHHRDSRLAFLRYRMYGQLAKTRQARIVVHDGVWCPQTATGTWIARRRGCIWPTGNSHPGDALAYGAAVLYPVEEQVRAAIRTPAPTVMEHVIRARSFMGV